MSGSTLAPPAFSNLWVSRRRRLRPSSEKSDIVTAPSRSVSRAGMLGWGLLAVFALGGGLLGDIYGGTVTFAGLEVYRIRVWQWLYGAGVLGFLVLLWSFRARPATRRTIVLGAILLRLPLLLSPPNNDCNRYIWEGRIQNLGLNPYAVGPLDESAAALRDEIWQAINKKQYTTIYPPLAELEFRWLAWMHYSVKTPQIAHTILDIGVVLALGRLLLMLQVPSWYLAIYALCPVVLAAFAHDGHNDPLMILAVIGFLAALKRERWSAAGLALGLAILAKTVPAILLVVLVRRSRRAVVAAVLTAALGYVIYLDAGWQLFRTLHHFPSQSHFNNAFDEIRLYVNGFLERDLLARDRNLVCLVLLTCAAVYRTVRPRDPIMDARWLMALVVLMLPVIHFWYLTWVLVLVAINPRGYWSWLALTGTMVLYWQAEWAWQTVARWRLTGWEVGLLWLPFFAAWMAETVWRRMKDQRGRMNAEATKDER